MVQKIFKIIEDSTSKTGYVIEDPSTSETFDFPECCLEALTGKYITADEMISKISTVQLALAGISNSMNMLNETYYHRNSVLKSFGLKSTSTIDDTIDDFMTASDNDPNQAIRTYESYHIIYMDRDVEGKDDTIHAYINTPKDGKLRCVFDKSIRLNAKRNNIKFWIEDYKIESGSAGGKFVRPIGIPEEII